MNFFQQVTRLSKGTQETVENKRIGWNRGLPRDWTGCGHRPTKTIDGILVVDLKKQHGATAAYHMEKYGNLDRIGTSAGAKKGNTNARCRIIQGKSVAEWSKKLGVSRKRVVAWYQTHGSMKGCCPGQAGGWNKGLKLKGE